MAGQVLGWNVMLIGAPGKYLMVGNKKLARPETGISALKSGKMEGFGFGGQFRPGRKPLFLLLSFVNEKHT